MRFLLIAFLLLAGSAMAQPVVRPSPAWVFANPQPTYFTAHGGKNDGQDVTVAVTTTSGSNALEVDTATFTRSDIGKAIGVWGAGAAGAILSTTITGFTDTTHVTLAANAGTTLAAVSKEIRWGTDNTNALQTLVNSIAATTQIDTTIYFPSGMYLFNGPFQAYPGGLLGKAIVLVPDRTVTLGTINITLVGQTPPAYGGYSVIGTQEVFKGGTILTTTQGDASGAPSIIGGASITGGYTFTSIAIGMKDLTVRTYNDPAIIGIDGRYLIGIDVDHVNFDNGTNPQNIVLPTHPNAIALATPLNNNGAYNRVTNVNIIGYDVGVQINEHTDIDNVAVYDAVACYYVNTANHAMYAGRLGCYHGVTGIQFQPGFGVAAFNVSEYDEEWTATGAFTRLYDIDDTNNIGYGQINWHTVQATVGITNTLSVHNGTNLKLQQIKSPYNTISPAVPVATSNASPVVTPQGRLTLESGAPVQKTDKTAVGTIYYDAYLGNFVPVYDGAVIPYLTVASGEISLILDATNHLSGKVYDVFAVNVSGVLTLCTGPAWTSTAARGTGAGTTQIHNSVTGYWTNVVSLTHCYNNSVDKGAIAADQATYLGAFYATANAQTTEQFAAAAAAGGSNAFMGLSNAYNRVQAVGRSADATSSTWTYALNTWRSENASDSNRISWLDGLAQSAVSTLATGESGTSNVGMIGVSFDSNTAAPMASCQGGTSNFNALACTAVTPPLLGFHYAQQMENTTGATVTFGGALTTPTRQANMLTLQMMH